MKRIMTLVPALLLVALLTPSAQATCTGYHCTLGSCPWYELLGDQAFAQPSCGVWSYTGGASATTDTMCNGLQSVGQITYTGGFLHTGTIAQTVTALDGATALDNFSLQYTIEAANLSPGDQIKVTITDVTAGTTLTTDTFTSDMWCNSVSHSYNGAGWKGHQLRVKFSATLASTGSTVDITGVTLWQQVTY